MKHEEREILLGTASPLLPRDTADPDVDALVRVLLAQEDVVEQSLSAYAMTRPVDPAWLDEAPRPRRDWRWLVGGPLVALAAAVLLVAGWPVSEVEEGTGRTTGLSLADCGGREVARAAYQGALTPEDHACLARVDAPADEARALVLRMADLRQRGDESSWAEVAGRYVQDVDIDPHVRLQLALYHRGEGDLEEAIALLDPLVADLPADWDAGTVEFARTMLLAARVERWQELAEVGDPAAEPAREDVVDTVLDQIDLARDEGREVLDLVRSICILATEDPGSCE